MHIVPTVISLVQFHIKYQFFAALLRIPTVLLKRFTYLAKTFAYFCNSMDAWEILLCVWRIYNDSFKLRNCANGHWYSLSMWCENASLRSPNAVFLHHSVCCSNCVWAYSHRAAVGEACYDSEGGSWILQGGLKVDEGFSPPVIYWGSSILHLVVQILWTGIFHSRNLNNVVFISHSQFSIDVQVP